MKDSPHRTNPRIARLTASPGLWTAAWLSVLPAALQLAPRLQPEPEIDYRARQAPPVAPPLIVEATRPVALDPLSPATATDASSGVLPLDDDALLGVYVWEGCDLQPADPWRDRDRPDLHVRTAYVPGGALPQLLSELEDTDLSGIHLGFYTAPRDLTPLSRWRSLRYLTFEGDHLDDEAMAPLSALSNLQMLEIGVRPYESNSVTDAGLAHLAGLHELTYLGIHAFEGVRGPGLRHLSDLRNLEVLELSYTNVDDDSLKHLSDLSVLRTLSLQKTRITDAGLAHLARLPALHTLDLRQTSVTPEGIEALADFPSLRRVVLHYNDQYEEIQAARRLRIQADGIGWIRGTVGCEDWSRSSR